MTTPTKKKMSLLRRHRLLEDDVRRVMAHLTAHKRISTSDVLSRPRLKKKKDSGPTEEIPWAHAPLSGSWQQPSLKPGPNNSKVLYTKENGEWKLVVPEEQVEKFLRKAMLDPKSGMPLGRDSAYHHAKDYHRGQPAAAVRVPGEAGRIANLEEHPERAGQGRRGD
jgi:hypothetical protein